MIPGLGGSSGEGKGYSLQYSGLENSIDCIVHGVAKSQTQLSDFNFHFHNTHPSLYEWVGLVQFVEGFGRKRLVFPKEDGLLKTLLKYS